TATMARSQSGRGSSHSSAGKSRWGLRDSTPTTRCPAPAAARASDPPARPAPITTRSMGGQVKARRCGPAAGRAVRGGSLPVELVAGDDRPVGVHPGLHLLVGPAALPELRLPHSEAAVGWRGLSPIGLVVAMTADVGEGEVVGVLHRRQDLVGGVPDLAVLPLPLVASGPGVVVSGDFLAMISCPSGHVVSSCSIGRDYVGRPRRATGCHHGST